MTTLYRAEGAHDQTGYAGTVDARTGRYFGTYERATRYLTPDRHLYEVDVEVSGQNPDDHVLVSAQDAATKRHSDQCPCGGFTTRAGLTAAWNKVRGDLLEAHGIPRDRKRVNLRSGSIVMDVQIGDRWVAYTDDRSAMCDRVDQGGTFRLRPLVWSDT